MIGISHSSIGSNAKAFVTGAFNEGRDTGIGRRRWRRRWCISIVMTGGAAGRKKQGHGEEECNAGRFHSCPHNTLSPNVLCEAFREVNASQLKMLLLR
jgi:hypothetical protein